MKFGLTQQFTCSYLEGQKEQLLVFVDEQGPHIDQYELLISSGFRRSGEQIYRPNCPNCQACQSIRIPVQDFTPSKSQKRVLTKNRDLSISVNKEDRDEYYPLYEQYINQRHSDGSMYPASYQQYLGFIRSEWAKPLFVEIYKAEELIGIAVTDELRHGFSALYTFFLPSEAERSLGTFAILKQIELAKDHNKPYVYLGYQVDDCQKMNYKSNFMPHERFFDNNWQLITKKRLNRFTLGS